MSEARPDTWMPMYWADYWKDTEHLSREEDSSYMRLIGHYWTRGEPLPNDDARLARLARCTPREWAKTRPALAEFFDIRDGHWYHGRIDKEIAKAQSRYGRRVNAQANFKRNSGRKLGGQSGDQIGAGIGDTTHNSQSTIVDRAGAPDERIDASLSRVPRRLTDEERDLASRFNHGSIPAETTDHDVARWQRMAAKHEARKAPQAGVAPAPAAVEPSVAAQNLPADAAIAALGYLPSETSASTHQATQKPAAEPARRTA